MAKADLNQPWYLFCPTEIMTIKGYCLEDYYGEEWEKRYHDCVNDTRLSKRSISIKDIVRLVLRSAVETGTPFTFNRDTVNRANPNAHRGIIYCSNLCTEIAQNMAAIETVSTEIRTEEGDTGEVKTVRPGDFVVCNLASLSLGHLPLEDEEQIKEKVSTVVRALDNVIDLNFYPLPFAQITNQRYRSIGLGVSGYHHALAIRNIRWESEEHLRFVDRVFEQINYAAIEASADGISWTLSTMVDISRDPRRGRVSEGSGEDPFLGSLIAQAMVKGYQGNKLSDQLKRDDEILACVKHFALYGAANDSFPPCEASIEASVGSVMAAFNEVDGVPATASRWLMTDVLRDQWGFNGFVVTDYTGTMEMVDHGIGDLQTVTARAINAGVDMDMVSEGFVSTLKKSIQEGKVSMTTLNTAGCFKTLINTATRNVPHVTSSPANIAMWHVVLPQKALSCLRTMRLPIARTRYCRCPFKGQLPSSVRWRIHVRTCPELGA